MPFSDRLEPRIRGDFVKHTKEQNGLIANPDGLVTLLLQSVSDWLLYHQKLYKSHDDDEVAEAIRDLRVNLLRSM